MCILEVRPALRGLARAPRFPGPFPMLSAPRLLATLPLLAGALWLSHSWACAPASSSPEATPEAAQEGKGTKQSAPAEAPLKKPVFDGKRAWKDLETVVGFGPRPAGSAELETLRAFLTKELEALGLTPRREAFRDEVPVTPNTPDGHLDFVNLYADLEGRAGKDSPMVIVAGHIDTKFLPGFVGANDGGSSTAAVLELARAFASTGPRPVTYRFLFLDGEEAVRIFWEDPDNTYGSRHHAKQVSKNGTIERIKAFVLLDMVADKELRYTTELYSTKWLRQLFEQEAKKAGYEKYFGGRSQLVKDDHLPWLDMRVPAFDLIDLEYGPQNAYWHTTDDNLQNCSEESLNVSGQVALLGLLALEKRLTQ